MICLPPKHLSALKLIAGDTAVHHSSTGQGDVSGLDVLYLYFLVLTGKHAAVPRLTPGIEENLC